MPTDNAFAGIYPMLYAFFGRDGELDRGAVERQVEAAIRHGAHGIAVLGLASEVNKLTPIERRTLLEWTAEALDGRLPLAVTVAEANAPAQIAFVKAAADLGAGWVILQPPPVRGVPETEYLRFFGAAADQAVVPVAIQNAPAYIGIGLSNAGLKTLAHHHPNVSLLKAESPAIEVSRLIEEVDGAFRIFNGRAGLELTDNLRAGCVGMIPALDALDVQVRVFDLMRTGRSEDEDAAERLDRSILPLIVFLMQSIEHLLCYGKRLTARRLGRGEVHDRLPHIARAASGWPASSGSPRTFRPYNQRAPRRPHHWRSRPIDRVSTDQPIATSMVTAEVSSVPSSTLA